MWGDGHYDIPVEVSKFWVPFDPYLQRDMGRDFADQVMVELPPAGAGGNHGPAD